MEIRAFEVTSSAIGGAPVLPDLLNQISPDEKITCVTVDVEASGLVRVQPTRGTFVARLSIADLLHRFEFMAELEALCARLACRRADSADHRRIADSLSACEIAAAAGDRECYYAENTVFHQAIYRAAHNPCLSE